MLTLVFAALAVVAATAAVILFTRLQKQTAAHRQLVLEHDELPLSREVEPVIERRKQRAGGHDMRDTRVALEFFPNTRSNPSCLSCDEG